ncbi:MAG: sugar phosphate isomerase/epimerase family protein [Pirellulaceae bacterium]
MMKPAVSQLCTLPTSFARDVEEYAACGIESIEVWFTKLEEHLETHSLADVRALLERHGVRLPVASLQGGLLTSVGAARQAAWDLFARRLQLCQQLDIGVMVVACDVPGPVSDQDLTRTRASLREMAVAGQHHAVRIALEFQASAGLGNNLQTAAALVQEANDRWLGICLDAFHFAVGPSKTEDLAYLNPENLFHVQLSDLIDQLRETATDRDRILPGDGDLPLATIVRHLQVIDYQGAVSMEIMNPQIWQIPVRQVADAGIAALRRVLPPEG